MSDADEDRDKAEELADGDLIAILFRQHADIREALDRVTRSSGEQRKANFEAIKSFLVAHETAEQKVVRPIVSGDEEAEERNAEEKEADAAIAELSALDVDSNAFGTKFSAFKKAVGDHAEAEEDHEFPLVKKARSAPERIELGQAFLDALNAAS
jgi:hemerythrin superfamily protein